MNLTRPSGRKADELRPFSITPHFISHPEGSVLICCGNTKVLCNATIENKIPPFLKGKNQGWITAEYGMLPRSTNTRVRRESKGNQGGRSMEIQRLIGRSLRSAINLNQLGERTITLDCDVLQADGGTRTTAITGAFIALKMALDTLNLEKNPIIYPIAAISVGIYQGYPILDLDYAEDSNAQTDMNVVMNQQGEFIEIQGTAEGKAFNQDEMNQMLSLAKQGIQSILTQFN